MNQPVGMIKSQRRANPLVSRSLFCIAAIMLLVFINFFTSYHYQNMPKLHVYSLGRNSQNNNNDNNIYSYDYFSNGNNGLKTDLMKKDNAKDVSVLITGTGGFIGFSLAKQLREDPATSKATIVGLDMFNSYYDVNLKFDRADVLARKYKVKTYNGDVCNSTLLTELFDKYKFTHVVHLAAQAGVRYSLEKPLEYVKENVACFVGLIETIVKRPADLDDTDPSNDDDEADEGTEAQKRKNYPHFLYASSSSVYGLTKQVPFKETVNVNKPASVYAATKVMDELLAQTYYHLYGLKSIGMRFFTVYGPWGRPDMAAYAFTKKINEGETITVFNNGNMKRDFTFVTDIVDGIIRAMKLPLTQPEVFNLGNGSPVPVMEFVRVIEKLLNKTADIKYVDARTEVPITYADTSKAEKMLGYKSTTSVEEGMARYID
eukprot:Pgem_evm1s441